MNSSIVKSAEGGSAAVEVVVNDEIEAPPKRDSLKLKLPDVSSEQPWHDDVDTKTRRIHSPLVGTISRPARIAG